MYECGKLASMPRQMQRDLTTHHAYVRLPEPLYKKLVRHAKREDLSMSQVIRWALEDFFEANAA